MTFNNCSYLHFEQNLSDDISLSFVKQNTQTLDWMWCKLSWKTKIFQGCRKLEGAENRLYQDIIVIIKMQLRARLRVKTSVKCQSIKLVISISQIGKARSGVTRWGVTSLIRVYQLYYLYYSVIVGVILAS